MRHDWDLYDSQHLHTLHARHNHIKSNSVYAHTHTHTHTYINKTESVRGLRGARGSTIRSPTNSCDTHNTPVKNKKWLLKHTH